MSTSEVLNESRNVLYGDGNESEVTLDQVYKLLSGMNSRLTKIEKDVATITQLNDIIRNLMKDFKDLKQKVGAVEAKPKILTD